MNVKCKFLHLISFFILAAITNAAVDLSPVLLGILFTLVLLCFVIFAKVYCYRSTTTIANDLHSDSKHLSNINYKHDAAKVSKQRKSFRFLTRLICFESFC